jgi:hypothetical protein
MSTPVYLRLFLFLRIGVPSVVICYRASYYCASKSESMFNRSVHANWFDDYLPSSVGTVQLAMMDERAVEGF